MTTLHIAILALQGILFAVWAVLAFALLFQLRRRAADKTGRMFPGPITFVDVTRDWLSDPTCQRARLRFAVLTGVLLAITAVFAMNRP